MNARRKQIFLLSFLVGIALFTSHAKANVFRQTYEIQKPHKMEKKAEDIFGKILQKDMFIRQKELGDDSLNKIFDEYLGKAHPNEIFDGAKYYKTVDPLSEGPQRKSWREEIAIFLHNTKIPRRIFLGDKTFTDYYDFKNSKVFIADQIAKVKVYEIIEDNWNIIQTTVFAGDYNINCENYTDLNKCPAFKDVVSRKINAGLFFSYQDTIKDQENFVFEFQGDDGYVKVNKNLKSAEVVLGISYYNDNNRLAPGAEKYRTMEQAGIVDSPQPGQSAAPAGNGTLNSGE